MFRNKNTLSKADTSADRMLAPPAAAMSDFNRMLHTPLGTALLHAETEMLHKSFAGLAGYNCLQLSAGKGLRLCDSNAVGQCLTMGYGPGFESEDQFWADYQSFPVAHDCIDIVLLHHVLEFSSDPTEIIREADRTLTDSGYLLIVGFNPVSLWPLYQLYQSKKYHLADHAGSSVRAGRVHDWLTALNYEVLKYRRFFSRLPVNNERWMQRSAWLDGIASYCRHPFGMLYFTLARKKTTPMNPLFNDWRRSALSANSSTVRPASSQPSSRELVKK